MKGVATTCSVGGVRWLKTVGPILLLALWLPATSHELLEQAGWIHTEHTPGDTDTDHDAADGICLFASNHVLVPQPDLAASPLLSMNFTFMLPTLMEASVAAPNGPDPPGACPPELSHTWQFSSRASLPPRAPSLIA